jgi:hypothetical protein
VRTLLERACECHRKVARPVTKRGIARALELRLDAFICANLARSENELAAYSICRGHSLEFFAGGGAGFASADGLDSLFESLVDELVSAGFDDDDAGAVCGFFPSLP